MRLKFQPVDLKDKEEQGYCCYSLRKGTVCIACTSLPWEEMFSQILSSIVPKACWHASFRDRCQRQAVVLRITAHIRQVCCHNSINHRIILHNDPSNLVFYLLHSQAATSLKKTLIYHEMGWELLYILFSFRSKLICTLLFYIVQRLY